MRVRHQNFKETEQITIAFYQADHHDRRIISNITSSQESSIKVAYSISKIQPCRRICIEKSSPSLIGNQVLQNVSGCGENERSVEFIDGQSGWTKAERQRQLKDSNAICALRNLVDGFDSEWFYSYYRHNCTFQNRQDCECWLPHSFATK